MANHQASMAQRLAALHEKMPVASSLADRWQEREAIPELVPWSGLGGRSTTAFTRLVR